MSVTADKIKFSKYGGIVFANELTADSENPTTLSAQKIVATDDANLLDTTAKQTASRHVRAKRILIRSKR